MGQALTQYGCARDVFAAVDDALGEPLSKLIWQGPEAELTLTRNTQPALLAVSLAVWAVALEKGLKPFEQGIFMAGHSLGEYSALTAAGALDLADAARLLRLRGLAMQEAVGPGEGAMAALLGLDWQTVLDLAARAQQETGEVCVAANDNAPGQVVVSGTKAAIERVIALARAAGGKRAIILPVSAPFHSPLMAPAAQKMAKALANTALKTPLLPIIANVTARPAQDPETLRSLLVTQVTATVRWRETIDYMAENGVQRVIEIGAGNVLCGLVKRINPAIETISLSTIEDIEKFLVTQ
jgi:[acyl-carrier-protein] S-malonyltransferase